jgi:hypothetical protein
VGFYEHGNETSGSLKFGELDWLNVLLASEEELCSMVLVGWFVCLVG